MLSSVGLIEHFSTADRKIADWFMLTMTTGFPWGPGVDSRLQVSLFFTILDWNAIWIRAVEFI